MSISSPVLFTTFCCCLGCFGFGLQIGFSSPAIPQLLKKGELLWGRPTEASFFGSLGALGGAFGCLATGWLTEAYGRRLTSIISSILFIVGWTLIACAGSVDTLLLGRFITGATSSIIAVLSPTYVAETSPKAWRGILVTVTCFCITLGVFCGFFMGLFLGWRHQAGVGVVLAAFSLLLVPLAPETPRFLVRSGNSEKACQVLEQLQGKGAHLQKELLEIEASLQESSMGIWEVLVNPSIRHSLLTAVGLLAFCSLTGIGVIMFFMSSIFKTAGYSDRDSLIAPAIIVGLQLISIIVSGLVIDRVGRLPLLVGTGIGMAVSYTCMAFSFYLKTDKMWVLFLSLVGFKFSFGLGWGVVAPLMATEINPTKSRGPAVALSHMTGGFVSFALASMFNQMQDVMGSHWVLGTYGIFCLMGSWFAMKYVPETKGKTLEEIEVLFKRK